MEEDFTIIEDVKTLEKYDEYTCHHMDEYTCHHMTEFHVENYNKDMYQYEQELARYKNMNWLKKLFYGKPTRPNKEDYMY